MATTKAVGAVTEAPPVAAAPFGLINSETLQKDTERWEGGIGYESLDCAALVELWGMCDPDATPIVDGTGKDRNIYAPPIGITVVDTCTSTMSGSAFRDHAEDRVTQLLEAATQKALEAELKMGYVASLATPLGRWLTDASTIVVEPTGVCPKTAVALLEDAYSACNYGGLGVLHVTRGAAQDLKLEKDGDVLRTHTGTLVIVGSGYAPTGTEPAPWDGNWAFITGPTQVWLGDISVYPESLDMAVSVSTNDIRFKAERMAAVAYDGCCAFASKVDLRLIC